MFAEDRRLSKLALSGKVVADEDRPLVACWIRRRITGARRARWLVAALVILTPIAAVKAASREDWLGVIWVVASGVALLAWIVWALPRRVTRLRRTAEANGIKVD
jgi:hypothetical protein